MFRRIGGLLAFALGFLGLLICLAGTWGIWRIAERLYDANDKVCAAVDRGLDVTQERIRSVQKRMENSRITSAEFNQKLQKLASQEAKDRIVQQLEIEAHADKLVAHLATADSWLDTSVASIHGLQQLTSLGQTFGAQVDPAALDESLRNIESIQAKLQDAEKSVQKVRDLVADKEDEPRRLARASKLLGRTLATLSELDSRLERVAIRIGELRTDVAELKARTDRYITFAAIACWTLLAWIAAGQIALCRFGWIAIVARNRSPVPGPS